MLCNLLLGLWMGESISVSVIKVELVLCGVEPATCTPLTSHWSSELNADLILRLFLTNHEQRATFSLKLEDWISFVCSEFLCSLQLSHECFLWLTVGLFLFLFPLLWE